ncbi:restriction endonuclease subunit S [Bacteroides fragilis]|jgi:putative type I DNA restriction-modification
MELKKYRLGEILELQRGYDLPSSQQKAGNVLVAGSNGIIGYHNEIRGNHPCITVGRSGSVGKVHYYEQPTWAHNTALFVKDFKGNNPQYLYYFLKNLHLDEMFVKGSSVVPSLDRKVVHSLVVPFHKEVVCQKRIALVLSNIDRKIELNRAINQNLEAMAKQLYDYWFVQFDFPNEEGKPYKSSGGEMVWNEKFKREIPKGWKASMLAEEIELQYGFPFSTELFTEQVTSVPVVRIRDILDNSVSAYTTEEVSERYLLQKQDLLIGMDGNFHINYWTDNVSYLNQRSVRLRAKDSSNVSIVQAKYDIQPYIKAKEERAKGSTVGHLSDKDMKDLYVLVCPNKKLREKFDSILSMIVKSRNEITFLTKQLDELLPLLMNGQITIE